MAQKSANLILETLLQAQKSGELVEVYDDPPNPNLSMTVKVLQVDVEAEAVLLSIYLESGIWDGVQISKLADIHQVTATSKAAPKQVATIELVGQGVLGDWKSGTSMSLADLPRFESLGMTSVLKTIAQARQFCCLDLVFDKDESVYGYIDRVEGDCFSISMYSKIGESDGTAILKIDDIVRVSFFVTQCETRERLALARKNSDKNHSPEKKPA